MCQLQTYPKRKRVARHAGCSRQSVVRMLREIAFVLHMTRKVKKEIVAGK